MAAAARGVLGVTAAAAAAAASAAAAAGPRAPASHCQEKRPYRRHPVRGDYEVWYATVLHRHGHRTPFRVISSMPSYPSQEWDATWGQCRVIEDFRRRSGSALTGGHGGTGSERQAGGPPETGDFAAPASAKDQVYGPCYPGALTPLGEQQLRRLGHFMRKEYLEPAVGGSLLRPDEGPAQEALLVRSTRTKRTILSVRCLLQGLFPQVDEEELDQLVTLLPDWNTEILIPNHARCDRLRELFFDEKKRWEGTLLPSSAFQQIGRYEAKWGDGNPKKSVIDYADGPSALRGIGADLPPGVSEDMFANVKLASHDMVEFTLGRSNEEVKRLSMGPLLAEIQEELHRAAQGKGGPRLVIRSAHDVSVTGFLTALGLATHSWPAYGCSVFVELLKDRPSGSFLVRVCLYDGTPSASTKALDVTVTITTWDRLVNPLAINEETYLEQCRLAPGTKTPPAHFW